MALQLGETSVIVERAREAGDATMAEWVIEDVLDTTPEMIWGGRAEAVKRCLEVTVASNRYEMTAFAGKRPVGFCVLVGEEDANVGPCLGIMWNWVHPDYRGVVGSRFLRRAIALAKENQLPVLAYTQRVGLGEYRVRYRRVHGQVD